MSELEREKCAMAKSQALHHCIAGSRLYGLETPSSDHDHRVIYHPPASAVNPLFELGVHRDPDAEDTMYYPVSHLLRQLWAGKSEAVEIVFSAGAHNEPLHPAIELLAERREALISQQMVAGYRGMYRHLLQRYRGPEAQLVTTNPRRVDFYQVQPDAPGAPAPAGPPPRTAQGYLDAVAADQHYQLVCFPGTELVGVYHLPGASLEAGNGKPSILKYDQRPPARDFCGFVIFDQKGWRACREQYKRYKRTKGQRRDGQPDYKAAMHALRCLRMACEIAEAGVVRVYRDQDGEELRAIRAGRLSAGEIDARLREEETRLDRVEADPLPPRYPDELAARALFEEVLQRAATPWMLSPDPDRPKVAVAVSLTRP